jgi:Aminoglycoside-2''-adenylyltransferase
MDAADVLAVLDLLAGAGVEAWVDGGRGVDALVLLPRYA